MRELTLGDCGVKKGRRSMAYIFWFIMGSGVRTIIWLSIGFVISVYWTIPFHTVMIYVILSDTISHQSAEAALKIVRNKVFAR